MGILEYTTPVIVGLLLSIAPMRVFEGGALPGQATEADAPERSCAPAPSSPIGLQQDEKWYAMNEVGFHVSDEKRKPEQLSADQASAYFSEGKSRLSKFWKAPEYEGKVSASLQALRKSNRWFSPVSNPAPFAEVARFSSSRVVIRVLYPLGGYMWHHYFETLAVYELDRNQFVDGIFNLVEMEKRFSFTFKGIGHGTLAGFASNPDNEHDLVTKVLGRPDDEYMSQTPSYRLIYYRRYNISIEIHDGVVYAVEQGKPGWVER